MEIEIEELIKNTKKNLTSKLVYYVHDKKEFGEKLKLKKISLFTAIG